MPFDLHNLPHTEFDWPETLKIHQGNEALATQLSAMLLNQLPEFEKNFALASKNQNWQELGKQVHKLRGGLCYLSAPKLDFLLKNLEDQAHNNHSKNIQALYLLVIESMARLKEVLSQ